ncbi:glucosidase 2 subunit alpha precursor, putative [Entamoeba dispar SAW760]|uniref:Glucosidase II subunit alpha n=1 Tax=Entamoeba dispar (strain ATCC PRA-260 / SAW760) TaxID=370354 RepID=B0EAF9_ENTDS|nr:glucosidase 2 subunit alpha precursor, putative [Entamoeba dispar SAW760]EDR28472.1 glucosidase 2 subunit alpha precursor, putative [Entamoeba dispar SAW760]|eukprot:EDR28472.1 glucosidase 2 subunit alpha precursor, putative [Entamoeba dispar SAW760]
MFVFFSIIAFVIAIPNKPPTCSSRSWCNLNRFRPVSHYNADVRSYTYTNNILSFKLKPTWSINKNIQLNIISLGDNQLYIRYTYPSIEHVRFNIPTNTAYKPLKPQDITLISSSAYVANFKAGTTLFSVYKNASVVIDNDLCIGCTGQFLYREDVKSDYYPVGIDVEFPTKRLFGSGKNVHQPLPLTDKSKGAFTEPYHFYASGYTTFPVNSTHPQYGNLPVFISHKGGKSTAVLYTNPTDTFIDHELYNNKAKLLITSEDSDISFFIISKPNPQELFKSYYSLTGVSFMPPRFSLGFHNSKWGYNSQNIAEGVDNDADKYGFMYDALWLDIEHTQRKRYFTWGSSFPHPLKLQEQLKSKNRYLITIQDCHIASDNGYYVHDEGKNGNYFIKKGINSTDDYVGECWPLKSNWVDFLSEEARNWWAGLYSFDKYKDTTEIVYAWNDMNEPTEFDIQDLLVKKEAVHNGGILHKNVHNLYGMLQQMSTQKGLLERTNNKYRPFVLTRSYYIGSQKYGAMWTGDSDATWEYLSSQVSQLVNINMLGFLCGGDVGGFAHNPSTELLIRWYQAGALQPFFRQHSSQTASRREPWLFEQNVADRLKRAVNLRYQMLPYWYSLWYYHRIDYNPVIRAMYYSFPESDNLFDNENQYMIGDALLASPVIQEGETNHQIQIPKGKWYDYFNNSNVYNGPMNLVIPVTLDSIPLFGRGGYIITERMVTEGRKSGSESEKNDYLRVVIYDSMGHAEGKFYTDDGISVDNSDNYVAVTMTMNNYSFDYTVQGDYLYGEFINEFVLVTEKKFTNAFIIRGSEETEIKFTQENGRLVISNFNNHFSSQWSHWSLRFK